MGKILEDIRMEFYSQVELNQNPLTGILGKSSVPIGLSQQSQLHHSQVELNQHSLIGIQGNSSGSTGLSQQNPATT